MFGKRTPLLKSKREHDIVYEPRYDSEMRKATLNRVPVHMYSDLCTAARKHGNLRMLANLFKQNKYHIILLQDPKNMRSGHWISISGDPRQKKIYFFSTYGGKPDVEKVQWLDDDALLSSGQELNIFNDGFQDLQRHGWEIHYNQYPFQVPGDKTATCGIFTAAFLRSGLNPDDFIKQTQTIMSQGIHPAVYYFDKYFC